MPFIVKPKSKGLTKSENPQNPISWTGPQPTTFRSESSQVVFGVNEMSQVQILNSDHCI